MTTRQHIDKKLLSWRAAMMYHTDLLVQVPTYLISSFLLSPSEIEAIGNGVNEINDCNLSALFHIGMGKMASKSITSLDNEEDEEEKINLNLFETYGKTFASTNGIDIDITVEAQQLKTSTSATVASVAKAVAYFEHWENLFGNTLMAIFNGTFKGSPRSEQSLVFEIVFLMYFFPLYVILTIYYVALQKMPVLCSPSIAYKLNHAITSIMKILDLIPVGLISVLLRSVCDIAPPLEAVPEYIEIPTDEPGRIICQFVKPRHDMKVGLRFGCDRKSNLTISNIKPDSIASTTGLRIGDMVHTINGIDVKNMPPKKAAEILMGASGVVRVEVSHGKGIIEYDESTV